MKEMIKKDQTYQKLIKVMNNDFWEIVARRNLAAHPFYKNFGEI